MICPYCGKEAIWVSNQEIYGKKYGVSSHMIWLCRPCRAWVGCHQNTQNPKGTLAKEPLRKLRIKAHKIVDPLWREKGFSRSHVYRTLSDAFGFRIHIGEADEKTCADIIKTVPILFNLPAGK